MRHGFAADLGIVVAAAIVGTLVAAILGAANLGTALTFGQIAFAAALVWVLLKRRGRRSRRGTPAGSCRAPRGTCG